MSLIKEAYNPERMEQVRKLLENKIRKGLPVAYSINIDSFNVIPRTTDVSEFDLYEEYLTSSTRNMSLFIYDGVSGSEQINEYRYSFDRLSKSSQSEEYSRAEMEKRANSHAAKKLEEILFRRNLAETKKKLNEANEFIMELQQELEKEQNKKRLDSIKWGEVGSVVLENIIKRNPQILSLFPGGEALAGVFTSGTESPKVSAAEPEVIFREKSAPVLSEKEQAFHSVFTAFEQTFDAKGLEKINLIMHAMIKEPEIVDQIADLILEQSPSA